MKIQEKQCSTCYKIKPLCDFEWRKDTNKIRAQCKECRITKAKEYSINNRKKRIDYAKEYYIKNINKVKERHKQYYIENKNTILEKSRRWKKDNKKTVKERSKVYSVKNKLNIRHNSRKFYLNNKSRILNKQKERYLNDNDFRIAVKKRQRLWVIINRDRINSLSRIRSKIKRRENQAYKLRGNISSAVRSALKKLGGSKGGKSTFQYLPYTVKELKEHLEKQFESWMNWNNWGIYNPKTWDDNDSSTWTWQIDHIIPQSKLPYTSMEDDNFKKCWSLENLRPYSAKQNVLDQDRKR